MSFPQYHLTLVRRFGWMQDSFAVPPPFARVDNACFECVVEVLVALKPVCTSDTIVVVDTPTVVVARNITVPHIASLLLVWSLRVAIVSLH